MTITEFVFGFSTMILGSFLGIYVDRFIEWRSTSKFGNICGEWHSISHGGDQEIVKDKITIVRKSLRLYFSNSGNDHGYLFDGYLHINKNNVVGTWRSLRPGSTANGQVLMLVNPQGTSISGFYSGDSLDGKKLLLGWVLSRDAVDQEQLITRLRSTIAIPR